MELSALNLGRLSLPALLALPLGRPAQAQQLVFNKARKQGEQQQRTAVRGSSKRELQILNLNFVPGQSDVVVDEDADSIFQASGNGVRTSTTAVCRVLESSEDGQQLLETAMETTLDFIYEAETLGPSPSSAYETVNMPQGCDLATVYAFADELCNPSAWNCILFISIKDQDERDNTTECENSEGTGQCFAYKGDIVVSHTNNCTQDDIREAFISVMSDEEKGMASVKYINDANTFAGTAIGNGAGASSASGGASGASNPDDEIVFVRLAGGGDDGGDTPPVFAGIAGTAAVVGPSDGSVTAGGWAVAALVGLLLLLLLLMLLVTRRREKKQTQQLEDDIRSLRTDWSNGASTPGGKSYMTANVHNLAAEHSKLDVHKCKSATCEVCKSNIGKVDMLPVNQSQSSTARALVMRQGYQEQFADEKPWRQEQKQEQRRVPTRQSSQEAEDQVHVEYFQPGSESEGPSSITGSDGEDKVGKSMLL
mmetsp:Transcript_10267/g.13561  ORF Transcript_10267/g.13561 Transcript_10267/m.13561 type:complete len:482 (-) Transcript_10267:136-1581(-)|eukprot:CAMPEP_0198145738 /NCGR_PEP_ID=MMETSP1443-20131203/24986_1 /TAXON_ID=186043 /ORGANISM="Entomoneis sp., Strain CCMP2396" /LENGTH=481 /DNA_ID=CAMNT_0043809449 /DNA_START=91 /DNA_END=1536 /DNA_ORIENTATION=+